MNTPGPCDPRTPTPTPAPHRFPHSIPRTIGNYQILGPLGRGGMGLVFRAEHIHLKRPVALKILPSDSMRQPSLVARFFQEMQAVGRLDHANLVRASDAGSVDGFYFLAMDLLEGLDLAQLSELLGPLSVADACEIVRQAAIGLACLHGIALVHRDVKPSNVFLTDEGIVKVLDLGLAHLQDRSSLDERLTGSGLVLGTADYIAPEQALEPRTVDLQADLYALGCTFYKLLTGRAPFSGPQYDTAMKKLHAHASEQATPVETFRNDLVPEVRAALDRMMAKPPADRPANAAAIERALAPHCSGADLKTLVGRARAQAHAGGRSGPDDTPHLDAQTKLHPNAARGPIRSGGTIAQAPTTAWRRRRWWWAALPAALALAGLIVWLIVSSSRPDPQPKNLDPIDPPQLRVWHDLLKQPPEKLRWNEAELNANLTHDPKQFLLRVNSKSSALLGLNSTKAKSYQFQMGVQQFSWEGHIGLFFGYHEVAGADGVTIHYQRVLLIKQPRGDRPQTFIVLRQKVTVFPAGNEDSTLAISEYVPHPEEQEQILEITVQDQRLTRVVWGGKPLDKLVQPAFNDKFDPADYQGKFGVFLELGAGTFRNPRFMLLEE